MKKLLIPCFALIVISVFALVLQSNQPDLKGQVSEDERPAKSLKDKNPYDEPDGAMAFEIMKTRNPQTGLVPQGAAKRAFLEVQQRVRAMKSARTGISGVNWVERGPDNVGGRTRAIAFDPSDTDNKKVWAGGVGGGLWYNNDITSTNSQWYNVDDFWTNIAVTAIAFDPTDDQVMYVGTGEGFYNADAIQGAGIWKSSDGGTNFTQLSSTDNSTFNYVQKIIVNASGDVFAATRDGSIQRSQNGGTSWTRVLNSGSARAADLEMAANGDLYAALGIFSAASVYRSTDGGDNWSDVSPSVSSNGRIELAIAPSQSSVTGSSVLYAAKYDGASSGNNDCEWVKKSTDGGANWSDITIPSDLASGDEFTRGQAWYDLILAVHPTDEDIVLMGGIDLFRTSDGGTNWTGISQWYGGFSKPYVHADQHAIVFRPGNNDEVVFGNDGGVYYSENAGSSSSPSFKISNNGYNVTQFYAVAMQNTSASNYFLAGAQDNGSQQFTQVGINTTEEVSGGDGAFTFIDQDDPTYQLTSYIRNTYYLSTNSGSSFSEISHSNQDDGLFINPADYDSDADILYAAGNAGQLIRYSGISGSVSVTVISPSILAQQITAIIASPYTANKLFVGTSAGSVFAITSANGTPSVTNLNLGGGYVSSIDIGASENELLATVSSYGVTSVYYSSDGGSNWTDKDQGSHGLPDMPVRWGLFNPNNTQEVLIATEQGVWSTDDITASNPAWEISNTGLANVRCDMLQYRDSDGLVVVATHGRGLFTSDIFATETVDFTAEYTEWYVGAPLQFTDGSLKATSWEWDFDNNVSAGTDATTQNPTHTYTAAGTYDVRLTVNMNSGTAVTKSSYVTIVDAPAIPYLNDFESDGGAFLSYGIGTQGDERWEWGAGTNGKGNFNPTNSAATLAGSASWITNLDGHHGFNTKYALESPPFNFVGGSGQYVLEFDYRAATGTNAGMNIEYSTDGGSTWAILGAQSGDANALSNWYTDADLLSLGADGWTGGSFAIVNSRYDISSLIGQSDVRFRFVFAAVGFANDGFQIDNFEISGATPNAAPTLTSFADAVETVDQDTEVEITFAEMTAQGDEADSDGTVDGFVVKSVTSGTLKIGANAGAATAFASTTNDLIDASNNAYWTPANGVSGTDIAAFEVVAQDDHGDESSPNVTVNVDVTAVDGWDGSSDGDWGTAANWSTNTVPGSGDDMTIHNVGNAPVVTGDFGINNITLSPGSNVTINSGSALAIFGTVSGTGTFTVNRDVSGNTSTIYTMLSSPVAGANISSLGGAIAYTFDGTNYVQATGTMTVGEGYYIYLGDGQSKNLSLTGVPNSGQVDVVIPAGQFKMVGNPYSAAIDFLVGLEPAMSGSTTGSIYIWDDGGSDTGSNRSGDYVAINIGGSTGSGSTGNSWNGNIGSMQGFFVEGDGDGGTLSILPSMQTTDGGDNSDGGHFRTDNILQKLKLSLSGNGLYNETIVLYSPSATYEADYGLDAKKLVGNPFISFYTRQGEQNYAIQGLPIPTKESEVRADLGYNLAEQGTYELAVLNEEIFTGYEIHLWDKVNDVTYDLREVSEIQFEADPVDNANRFEIILSVAKVLGANDEISGELKVYGKSDDLNVLFNGRGTYPVSIFSMDGKQVFNSSVGFDGHVKNLAVSLDPNQVYLIKVGKQATRFIVR